MQCSHQLIIRISIRRWSYRHQFCTNIIIPRVHFRDVLEFHQNFTKSLRSFVSSFFQLISLIHSTTFHDDRLLTLSCCFSMTSWTYRLLSTNTITNDWLSKLSCMNNNIFSETKELCFQLREFFRINHRFDDLIFLNIKSYISDTILDSISSFAREQIRRTRFEKFREITSQQTWSQNWVIDKTKFRKTVIKLEKKVNLLSSFSSFSHFRHFSKMSASNISTELFSNTFTDSAFSSLTLKLFEILSSLDMTDQLILIDRILIENQRFRSFSSSSLTIVASSFNFTFYQHSAVRVFDDSQSLFRASSNQSIVSDSISEFVKDSRQTSISSAIVQTSINSKSTSSMSFAKIVKTNSKSLSFENFRSTTSNSSKQILLTTVEYEDSENFIKHEQSFVDMINNARNARFEAVNSDDTNSINSDQIANQAAQSIESTFESMFSQAQRMKIVDIVIAALRMNRQNNSSSEMSSSNISFVATSSMIISFETRSDRWNAIDLKFFDLIYDEKILITIESIQHVEKDTYFRDVHLFIDRVKNFVVAKRAEIIRNNLYTCLRESTMTWYTAKVSKEEKKLLKMKNNIDVWKRYLLKKFRKRLNVIMITITRERYILDDVRRRRESRKYADIIMRAEKSAELSSKSHLIMLIYNDLDLKFQRDILMLELITNIQNFLQCLDDKKNI
jgi:hypothetical protein